MSKDTQGPAFTTTEPLGTYANHYPWMSLRQYIAIKAMQGILANTDAPSWSTAKDIKRIKEVAYAMADAMLEEDES